MEKGEIHALLFHEHSHSRDLDIDESPRRSRRATPFVFDRPSSKSSSRCSSYRPSSPESDAGQCLPALRASSVAGRSQLVKKEDSDERDFVGCSRTKRQDNMKVPWPERRKRIHERHTVEMIVKGKTKTMYQCDYCGKLLGRHPDLYRHEKTHFISQKTLCCDIVKGSHIDLSS